MINRFLYIKYVNIWKMRSEVDNPIVLEEFYNIKKYCKMGYKKKKEFIPVKNIIVISINDHNRAFYVNDNNERISLSSLLKQEKRMTTARWIDHLCFMDAYGKVYSFKKYLNDERNLNIS